MTGIDFKKNRVAFDVLNALILSYLENSQGMIADRWCDPITHPITGDIAFTVKDRILPSLSAGQKGSMFELTPDWFPTVEI